MNKLTRFSALFLLCCLLVPMFSGCGNQASPEQLLAPPLPEPEEITYNTIPVETGTIARWLTIKNTKLLPVDTHVLTFGSASGVLRAIHTKYGEEVKAGDLLAELYLENILDFRGKFIPENSERMEFLEGEWAFQYAESLYFYQSDIDQFIATKAAAHTMVEYMMQKIGLTMEEIGKFYLAGAFGTHIKIESGVTIGLYPDIPREHIICAGNSSLLGARAILLDRGLLADVRYFVENTDYIQFGEVANFVDIMSAAQGIPHLDVNRYPSVVQWKAER